MKIETRFDVNNLVMHKFQRNPLVKDAKNDLLSVFEVIDIHTNSCYAGTQNFYDVRVIQGITNSEWVENKKITKYTDFSPGSNVKGEYMRFREDELIEAPKEIIDLILCNK